MDPTTTSIAMAATIGVLLTLVCTPVVRLLAFRVGLVAHPKADRWHRESVPMLGGVAIALATLVALAVSPVRALPVWLVVGGAAAAALVGLVDDFRSLKPQTKLLAQLAIAWCLRNPHVSSVILGASGSGQLQENLAALELAGKYDEPVWRQLEVAAAP